MVKRIKTKRKHRRKNKKRSQKIKFKPIFKNNKSKINKDSKQRAYNSYTELINSFIDDGLIKNNSKLHKALLKVDRCDYCDNIGFEKIISSPQTHIRALKYLEDKLLPNSKILDIGSGSGYLTAIFGYLTETNKNNNNSLVYGIDIYPELVKKSINNINNNNSDLLKQNKLNIIVGDGWDGYPELLFDAIHVGMTTNELPIKLWKQLKPGGKLIIPIKTKNGQIFRLYNKPKYWNRISKKNNIYYK